MKKALLYILLVGLIAWLTLTLNWWAFLVPAFVGGFLLRSEKTSFLCGFGTIALLFAVLILLRNAANDGVLLGRIGEMFQQSPLLIQMLSILLPAILAGMASWSGALVGLSMSRER